MGPSPAKPGTEKSPGPAEVVYYAVYLPPDCQPSPEDIESSLIFGEKSEALKLVKKYKKARFKPFRSMNDAMMFAMLGPDNVSVCPTSPPDTGEKPSPFRGPKPQDMVRFRKAIESRDLEYVKKTVWENPRYLVSSGDTPAILQEGSRYNALHIAAKAGDWSICAYVLQTINTEAFVRHMYGETGDALERCSVLLDLYLNTPDKAMNETPLHFAAKFGAARVVQVLVAYSQCDKLARNKFQQTAKEVICSRMAGADSSLKEEIAGMLEEQFYVPVLRSPDNSIEPTVGQPFSPTSPLQEHCGDVTSPVREVQAVAGPMPRHTAELFRRRWKTPPRTPGLSPGLRRPTLVDQDKGWERVGRELAQEWKVPWKEYWQFLDTYVNLNAPEGLQMLEDYLRKRFKNASEPQDSTDTPSTPDSIDSLETQPDTPPPPQESPMSELCSALRACRLSSERGGGRVRHPPPPRPNHVSMHNGDAMSPPTHLTSPHLYIDKSCQVFAKRIVDGFRVNDEDMRFLWEEMKHLSLLVTSCRSDDRFSSMDWQRLHSRLGLVVAHRLDKADWPRVQSSLEALVKRRLEDCYSSDEEDALIDSPYVRVRLGRRDYRQDKSLHTAVICLVNSILSAIQSEPAKQEEDKLSSESLCAEAWKSTVPCSCTFLSPRKTHNRRKLSAHKKLDFSDPLYTNCAEPRMAGAEMCRSLHTDSGSDSSGEESDTSDTSDNEFFTPPSSPGLRSDEDQAMESPDEGPDVYIMGDKPSKLDMSVMEAIGGSELSKARFPNICRWRHSVLLHSQTERLSWLASPARSVTATPPNAWHRARSLHTQ